MPLLGSLVLIALITSSFAFSDSSHLSSANSMDSVSSISSETPLTKLGPINNLHDGNFVHWNGRTRYDASIDATWLNFSLSGFSVYFKGTSLDLSIQSTGVSGAVWTPYISVVIDQGSPESASAYSVPSGNKQTLRIASGLSDSYHSASVFKRSEGGFTAVAIFSVITDGDFYSIPSSNTAAKIEFFGDSITCGTYLEDTISTPVFSTASTNPLKTYAYLTKQKLNADISTVSASGFPLFYSSTKSSLFSLTCVPDLLSMADFDTTTTLSSFHPWDNSSFLPNAVVVNLGTNDSTYYGQMTSTEEKKTFLSGFKTKYHDFIIALESLYPNAIIICSSGMITLNSDIDSSIDDVVASFSDKVFRVKFLSQTVGGVMPNNHPNYAQQKYAANQLCIFLSAKLGIPYSPDSEPLSNVFFTKVLPIGSFFFLSLIVPGAYVLIPKLKKKKTVTISKAEDQKK
jgi:hypothetical protein